MKKYLVIEHHKYQTFRDDWTIKFAEQCRQIAPCNEPKETPIEVEVETHTDWRGQPYKTKVIKEVDNQDQSAVG